MKQERMKLKAYFVLGVLLLCAAFTQTARADETRDARIKAEMVENYLLWKIAWQNKDADRIISFESPDFTAVSKTGSIKSKNDVDADWRSMKKTILKLSEVKVEIKKLSIEQNRVVILANHFLDADMIGPDDNPHHVVLNMRVRDIWVNYDGAWMLKRTEEVDTKFMVDGKIEQ